jgi:hypothetical protein
MTYYQKKKKGKEEIVEDGGRGAFTELKSPVTSIPIRRPFESSMRTFTIKSASSLLNEPLFQFCILSKNIFQRIEREVDWTMERGISEEGECKKE